MSDVTNTVENHIRELLQRGPKREMELITEIIAFAHEDGLSDQDNNDWIALIEDLVERGEIIEVEYVLPIANYRVKSLYFPKGAEITIAPRRS